MALTTCASNIVQVPRYVFSVEIDIENVFGNAHRLDTSMQNVVFTIAREGMSALRQSRERQMDMPVVGV